MCAVLFGEVKSFSYIIYIVNNSQWFQFDNIYIYTYSVWQSTYEFISDLVLRLHGHTLCPLFLLQKEWGSCDFVNIIKEIHTHKGANWYIIKEGNIELVTGQLANQMLNTNH